MSRFGEVLKQRNFFLLWIGQIISQLGDRLDQMALIGFVYTRTPGSALSIAKILTFTIIPVFLIGPLAGAYVDRWDRRRTMYVCDFIRAGLVFTIPFFLFHSKSMLPIYLIIFIVFSVGRFFVPAKLSIVPEIVGNQELLIANSLVNTTGMIAAILGFGISGLIVEWLGSKAGFYLDSLSFILSGMCIFFISKKATSKVNFKKVKREIVAVLRKSVSQELKDGILYFVKNKSIRFAAGIIFILWSALGAVYTVIIVFVQKTLHSATKDLGFLIIFLGAGLFLGSLIYGRFGQRISRYKMIFISLVASGGMLVVFALGIQRYPHFNFAALLSFFIGIAVSPIMIASNTIIHNVSDSNMLGKIFSSLEIVMHLGFLLCMLLSSFLADRVSSFSILIFIGGLFAVIGILNLLVNNKITCLE
ncbi:MAG: MFS transporter [Candidatus Omnitrophica bacterium]|nr:MFS transporter [Candidatus Omnitrophota bacterium]